MTLLRSIPRHYPRKTHRCWNILMSGHMCDTPTFVIRCAIEGDGGKGGVLYADLLYNGGLGVSLRLVLWRHCTPHGAARKEPESRIPPTSNSRDVWRQHGGDNTNGFTSQRDPKTKINVEHAKTGASHLGPSWQPCYRQFPHGTPPKHTGT